MTDAKELLWLDDECYVWSAPIQTAVVVPPSLLLDQPDKLVVEYRHEAYYRFLPLSVWVLTAEGNITQYIPSQWQHFPSRSYAQFILAPHGHPDPVPVAIVRYVEAFKAAQYKKDTPC